MPFLTRITTIAIASLLLASAPTYGQALDQRDHVWAMDQDGIETPLYGCWQVVSSSNAGSGNAIGDVMVFPAAPVPWGFAYQGTIRGPDRWLWTKVAVFQPDGDFFLLERVDTVVDPDQWYVVSLVDGEGNYLPDYPTTPAQFAGEAPNSDITVYERIGCLGQTPSD